MLLTQDYVQVCYLLLGLSATNRPRVFFHDTQTAESEDRLDRYTDTQKRYVAVFGRETLSEWWPDEGIREARNLSLIEHAKSHNEILVKTLTGKTVIIPFTDELLTFEDVANKVQDIEGIAPDQQRVIFNGTGYSDGGIQRDCDGNFISNIAPTWYVPIRSVGVQAGSTLYIVLRMRGC